MVKMLSISFIIRGADIQLSVIMLFTVVLVYIILLKSLLYLVINMMLLLVLKSTDTNAPIT